MDEFFYSYIFFSQLKGDPGLAAKCLFELINEKPVKIAILGPPKSNPYQIVGQITPQFHLTQVRIFKNRYTFINCPQYDSLSFLCFTERLNKEKIRS